MSFLKKHWKILSNKKNSSPFEKVCFNRNLKTPQEIDDFINSSYENNFFDPYLLKDMDKAVPRILQAIKQKEKIMIYGDYDVDGITSTGVLFLGLQKLKATVSYRLPHRIKDGYGLNKKFIKECALLQVGLIITVDCGVSNSIEIDYANQLGIDVIVTDHHSVQKKTPNAVAIINPNQPDCTYPFAEIPGVVVAYKLVTALCFKVLPKQNAELFLNSILELVGLGIVSDCMPLLSENRFILKHSLQKLNQTTNSGLIELINIARLSPNNLDCASIGFGIAPRLNAAGRIASPYLSLDVLLGKKNKAIQLEKLNKERQKMVQLYLNQAEELIKNKIKNIIITHHDEWHVGVIGLIAGRLTEKYYRPSVIMQKKEDFYIGSARSIPEIDIMKALGQAKHLFTHFGGHKQAAGFSIHKDNLDAFYEKINQVGKKIIEKQEITPILKIDCEIELNQVNLLFLEQFNPLAPFGMKNPVPMFLIKNCPILNPKHIGQEKKHIKFQTKTNDQVIDVLGFGFGNCLYELMKHKNINMVVCLEKNIWNGKTSIQFRLIDWSITPCKTIN